MTSPLDSSASGTDIAIVGMAAHFPGARNVQEFWHNLRNGVESVVPLTDDELADAGVSRELLDDPDYVKSGIFLDDVEMFDAGFFGLSPRDAAIMDPQHRHFLECAWEALEDATCIPEFFEGRIGVFAGCGTNLYMSLNLLTNPELVDSAGVFHLRHTGNDKDFVATRVSYCFDLHGPGVTVQTACSTSLVATHAAMQSLLGGECDLALAGGVTIQIPHRQGYLYKEGEVLSPDGHCRAFDHHSGGTVLGSGAGIVVLRRLVDALESGDRIRAVIKASSINNDGSTKVGYLAPSVDGQAEAIGEAIALAGVDADTITYVETHGTGTPIGDPIEIAALTQAFRDSTEKTGFCRIGSVKSNIGHLDTAAGVAGLIKAVLALENREIPPSLNVEQTNPKIDFANTPFVVNTELAEWKAGNSPRRAGVSSLGVGGTNAHVILEEAPQTVPASVESRRWQLLCLSGRTNRDLDVATTNLAAHLGDEFEASLPDVSYTLQVGRRPFRHRRILACESTSDAVDCLETSSPKRVITGSAADVTLSVAFMFTGQGAQYVNMAADLYTEEQEFRTHVDACAEILRPLLDLDIRTVIYPPADSVDQAASQLKETSITQPALFVIEYSLAKLWMSWGIRPDAMIGHSIGEFVAACLSGVFSLESALGLVAARGRLMQSVPSGSMLVVPLPEEKVSSLLDGELSLAAVNAPSLCVVSGPDAALDAVAERLKADDVSARRLQTSHAFHSAMFEAVLEPFAAEVARADPQSPSIPFVSNVTGTWITSEDAVDPEYWARHLRQTVRFADGLGKLLEEPSRVLLEVGPGNTLFTFARQHPERTDSHALVTSVRHPKESISDSAFVLQSLGRLWIAGVEIDWPSFYADERRRRVSLPTYPFDRSRCWIEAGDMSYRPGGEADLSKVSDVADWFYRPVWKKTAAPEATESRVETWLVLRGTGRFGSEMNQRLLDREQDVVTVTVARRFEKVDDDSYTVSPSSPTDWSLLLAALAAAGRTPSRVVHLWSLTAEQEAEGEGEETSVTLDRSFYSLLYFAQALGKESITETIHLAAVIDGVAQVKDEPVRHPARATILGPCRTIPREFVNVTCQCVDVELPAADSEAELGSLVERVLDEVVTRSTDTFVAYRGDSRFKESFERYPVEQSTTFRNRLKAGGVYLVTGGLGGIGLVLAEHLARTARARLVLVGRSGLLPREQWDEWLEDHDDDDRVVRAIRAVKVIEACGGEVMIARADVTREEEMAEVVRSARRQFGSIDGVIHSAGVFNDGIIQLKTSEDVQSVLAPKITGTLVLEKVLREERPEFFFLCSSVSSITGVPGQVDNTAANAFLDAFARSRGAPVVTVDWGPWREVGVAARLASELGIGESPRERIRELNLGHPAFDRRVGEEGSDIEYSAELRPDRHWFLQEHRLRDGPSVLPGTAYLELARAAFDAAADGRAVEIRDVVFLTPVVIDDDDPRELRVQLSQDGDFADFVIKSGNGSDWEEHAQGTISYVDAVAPGRVEIEEIIDRCPDIREIGGSREHPQLDFGPRWANLVRVNFGENEALAVLELPDEFAADLADYKLHPALLDMATGAAQTLIPGVNPEAEFFVPASYSRLTVWRDLPQKFFSHIRYHAGTTGSPDVAVFDVVILDERGDEVVEIKEFVMKKIPAGSSSRTGSLGTTAESATPIGTENTIFELGYRAGILPREGVDVFERVLSARGETQLLVVSQNLHALMSQISRSASLFGGEAGHTAMSDRPELMTSYIPPTTEIEKRIAAIWEEILGISTLGINDDFFELGGHSLSLTQSVLKVRKEFKVDFPIMSLFETPTVAEFASTVTRARESRDGGKETGVERISRDQYRLKRSVITT